MKNKYILYTLALLTNSLLPACSDENTAEILPDSPVKEENVDKETVNANFSISTRATTDIAPQTPSFNLMASDGTTSIDYTAIAKGAPNEIINHWFMIFVQADDNNANFGKIAHIAHRENLENWTGGLLTEPKNRENFSVTLTTGKYHVFSFGNISFTDFVEAVKNHTNGATTSLSVGTIFPDIKDIVWQFSNQEINSTTALPLSSVDSDLEVLNNNPAFEIELERMTGKLQFFFDHQTSAISMKIHKFEMMPLRGKTYMLEHAIEGGFVQTPPYTAEEGSKTHTVNLSTEETLGTGWIVPHNTTTTSTYVACPQLGFYVNESVPEVSADYPLGHFKMKLTLHREISSGNWVKETRSSMLHNLTAIERNQFYLQPIMLTDWVLQPEIHYYPPIGGYPVVQVEENSSFEECYSTFEGVTSSSPFQIRLRIHDLSDPDKWYDVTDGIKVKDKVTVGGVQREQPYMVIVHDPDNVINHTTLSLDNSGLIKSPDGQLTGHFTGNKGRAIISVYANIEISTGVYYTYERDLYVITK